MGFDSFFAGFRALNLSSVQLKNAWFEIECLEIFCQRLWGEVIGELLLHRIFDAVDTLSEFKDSVPNAWHPAHGSGVAQAQ